MKIKNIQNLEIFIKTADCASISLAARQLELSPAVASAALKRLEGELGVMLFVRSTRNIRLTIEGERLLEKYRPLIEGLREVEESLLAGQIKIRGQLQISMPSDLGRNVLFPWINEFQQQYPEITLRIQASDRLTDVYREPVDLAIRYGDPNDSGLIALPLVKDNHRILCASPEYLKLFGIPKSPQELAGHNCLCFMKDETLFNRWTFRIDRQEISVKVSGKHSSDDSDLVRRWGIEGYGIMYRSRLDVINDIKAGRLIEIAPEWQGERVPLYLLCTDRRQLSPLVRLFKDFLTAKFETPE